MSIKRSLAVGDVERTASILEDLLRSLKWPEDAEHILRIRSTLEVIQSRTFVKLTELGDGRFPTPTGNVRLAYETTLHETPIDEASSTTTATSSSTAASNYLPHPRSKGSSVQSVRTAASEVSSSRPSSYSSSGTGKGWMRGSEEGSMCGEHVPLVPMTTAHPNCDEIVDDNIKDCIMTQRVLHDPFRDESECVAETSFMDELTPRHDGRGKHSTPKHVHLLQTEHLDRNKHVIENLTQENCPSSTHPGDPVNSHVAGYSGEEGQSEDIRDVLFPLRDEMSLKEIKRAVLSNQLSLKSVMSPQETQVTCDL